MKNGMNKEWMEWNGMEWNGHHLTKAGMKKVRAKRQGKVSSPDLNAIAFIGAAPRAALSRRMVWAKRKIVSPAVRRRRDLAAPHHEGRDQATWLRVSGSDVFGIGLQITRLRPLRLAA
jgi:hypothetical protein